MTTHTSPSSPSTPEVKRPPRPNITVGVEIGYSSIYVVGLREGTNGKLAFDDCQTFEYDPALPLDSASFSSALKTALKGFCSETKAPEIWASANLNRASLHHIQIPAVTSSRLPGAVYWALQREEPFLEKETVVDFHVEAGEEFDSNVNLNITGALAARTDIERLQQAFQQAGYPLSGIGLPLFAIRNLVNNRADDDPKIPVLICQLGKRATSVSVLIEHKLVFTRNIPIGLQNLIDILVKDTEPPLSPEQAGNLILKLGREDEQLSPEEIKRQDEAFSLLRPVFDRLTRQIERTLQYYQTNFNTEPIETIYVGGEIAGRGRLFSFLSEQLSTDVVALDPFDTPELQSDKAPPADSGDRIAYGPAYGLALESKVAGTNLAYTYQDRQREKKHRKIAGIAAGIFFLFALVSAGVYSWQQTQLEELSSERDNLARQLEASGPPLTETIILKSTEEVKALQKRRKAATRRYEGLAILSELTRLTPENISLLHLSAEMGSPIKEDAASQRKLLLTGVVNGERTSLETSLTIYIARLDQSPLFHEVEVDSTKLADSPDGLLLTFTLEVDTVDNDKTTVASK